LEQPAKTETEKVYEGNVQIHQRLLKRFVEFDTAHNEDRSTATMDYLIKLAGAIGYSQQVHSGLIKAYNHEKRLKDIERKLAGLPIETRKNIMNLGN